MTDPNYTHITMVIDRSGSMQSIREDAEGGVNTFIKQQAGEDGRCTLTLVQFDNEYEKTYDGLTLRPESAPTYELHPRGTTAMNDAIGRALVETGEYLSRKAEEERPSLVIFVIVTDGQENASKEYTGERIRQMIKTQEDQFSWKFTFLAANIDAFAAGSSMGMHTGQVMGFAASNVLAAYSAAGSSVTRARRATAKGLSSSDVRAAMSYSQDERDAAGG